MSSLRLIIASLWHHGRTNLAVAMAVAAATAVLTGALLVGDSMRGSLRQLTLDRLGRIDETLVTSRFFRSEFAEEIEARPEFREYFSAAVPVVMVDGTLSNATSPRREQASGTTVLGCDARFWQLGDAQVKSPAGDEIVLNQPLADKLNIALGPDPSRWPEVVLRIGKSSQIPADSPLGRKKDTLRTRRLKVVAVIPAEGVGRFGLRPTQQLPRNAYVAADTLQQMLEQSGKVNAILFAGRDAETDPPSAVHDVLSGLLRPKLADYGLALERTDRGYIHLTSGRMLLEKTVESAASKAFEGLKVQPALTYLANYIEAGPDGKAKIPYSTVTALDLTAIPPLGPFVDTNGQSIDRLADDEILLNRWSADDLAAQGASVLPGDSITLTYFEPESTHGKTLEQRVTLRLKAIVPMSGPAADPDFTPKLQGVTDKESIANWDPPFEYHPERVRTTPPNDQDDRYWEQYRTTPKAFVSLATGRRLWESRFGRTTSLRIPADDVMTVAQLTQRLEDQLRPADLGFELLPVKRLGLMAAAGTTPFGLLFLGFSMFLIAAAVMLVALLFRLGIEQRANEIGLLKAVGLRPATLRWLMLGEGLLVAMAGTLVGLAAGVGYAWLMLAGLKTLWLDAVSTPFLRLYITPASLTIGGIAGLAVAGATIVWALRVARRAPVRRLLAGQMNESTIPASRESRRRAVIARGIAVGMLVLAVLLGLVALQLGGEAQAGAFFGAGALVLGAELLAIWNRLRTGDVGPMVVAGGPALARLAMRNTARNPGRSTLTIGLIASASFLIVAISAFRISPPAESRTDSGTGGFAFVAQSDQPIHQDLNTAMGRSELGFTKPNAQRLADSRVFALRVQAGDDASCLNLYQPRQPRILGVPRHLVERGGFAWSKSAAVSPAEKENPWLLLDRDIGRTADGDPIVPVVLDENTVLYSLHLGDMTSSPVGKQFDIDNGRGETTKLEVVGLLKNSMLQGDVLMAESAVTREFPDVSGYRLFLIDAPSARAREVQVALEETLADYGFDVERANDRLAGFLAVQNTYLSTFQSLGGLGLLLGTLGLAAVQIRSVFERRGELALLRAVGFQHARLARLVMLENAFLLLIGLGVGVAAAAVVIMPHLLSNAAGIPWPSLATTLAVVLGVGLLAGLLAVRAMLRAPLLASLRGE